ncbi:MAG: hypothetical protein J6C75_05060 [Oscillospiraceae bacterium]|nr:hypothetical protein [Oscillospiraceae bacterium]
MGASKHENGKRGLNLWQFATIHVLRAAEKSHSNTAQVGKAATISAIRLKAILFQKKRFVNCKERGIIIYNNV